MAGAMVCCSSSAEQPVLAGVRIEPGHGDSRLRDAESRQLARGQRDRRLERRLRQRPRHLASGIWMVASTTRSTSE